MARRVAERSSGNAADHPLEHPPYSGAIPVGDAVLDAAAACVQRNGFDATSLEEIAAEAGVSRTTLYRRFGNRESLFTALLVARARPFRQWSSKILLGPGSIQHRLETVLAQAIMEMQRVGWLDRSLHAGLSPTSIRLFKAAHSESAAKEMAPLLEAAIGDQAHAAGVGIPELVNWIADQMIGIASGPVLERDEMHKRVRFFVIRVVLPSADPSGASDVRLARIEADLAELLTLQRAGQRRSRGAAGKTAD